jgi:RHS repeat-associated protein
MGTYANGAISLCESVTRCVKAMWPGLFFVLERPHVRNNAWHGTVLEDKRDEAGTYYRRNRYYDPATGRFTQEDPIGLAGGLNLYGFANGDPVSYGDPLGLAVCSKSGIMRRGIERAVNGNISWDSNGCVTSMSQVRFRGGSEWAPIRAVFTALVERMDTFTVVRGNSEECVQKGCTGNMPLDRTYTIYDQDWDRIDGVTGDFERGYAYAGCGFGNPLRPPTMALGALIIHELLWHGQGPLNGRLTPDDQSYSFKLENIYNRAHGRRERCGH